MRVLVTGVSAGLGAGLAAHHLAAGDEVFGVSRREAPAALTAAGLRHARGDLARFDEVAGVLGGLLDGAGDLDLVYLNAGILGPIEDLGTAGYDDLRKTMAVNVWSQKAVLDALSGAGVAVDQVVAISSGASVSGARGWSGYAVSKAALNMLVKLYAAERPETHFTALAPGLIDTGMQATLRGVDAPEFETLDRLRAARGTPAMPGPEGAAAKIAAALPRMRGLPSGSYADIRKAPLADRLPAGTAPLDAADALLGDELRGIVARQTPIPSIAKRAGEIRAEDPRLVRADIGQISGFDPELEVLYGPPVGLPRLRELIAEGFNLSHGLTGDAALGPANVCVTSGAAQGLSLLFRCFAPGRVVALPRGHWSNYRNGVELAGGTTVVVDFFDEEGRLDVAGLKAALTAHGAAALVANFPCNPTGAVLTPADAEALAGLARELGVVVIGDEVYDRLRFDGGAPLSLLPYAPGHVISVSSASKEYLLPGARVGFVLSARPEWTDTILRKLVRASTASPNVLGQRKLIALLEGDVAAMKADEPPPVLTRVRDEMKARRDRLLAVLAPHGMTPVGRPGHKPEGTIFLMAELPDWWSGDDAAFAAAALEAGCVSTVPGSAFGIPGAVRFSFGGMTGEEIARLGENLDRLKAAQGA